MLYPWISSGCDVGAFVFVGDHAGGCVVMKTKKQKSALVYACMEMSEYKTKKRKGLSEAYLRRPYMYTSAECRCAQLERLHEFDWLK